MVENKYEVLNLIGKGGFGYIYKGLNKQTNEEIAIKFEHFFSKPQLLFNEYATYQDLIRDVSLENLRTPNIYDFITDEENQVCEMVMELMGPNLNEIFKKCQKKFSLKTILMLAEQMLLSMEFIHSKGIIHRDIKPENWVIGTKEKKNRIYLIDFGLSTDIFDKEGKHVPYQECQDFEGSAIFASVNTHFNIAKSRRDDLFSLGYIFLYFLRGELPWEKERGFNEVFDIKRFYFPGEKMFETFPKEFADYINYCDKITFLGKPDYEYLQNLFKGLMDKSGYQYDYNYDWLNIDLEK